MLQVKLHLEDSKLPTRADPGAAGYDLFSPEDRVIKAWSRECISLGLSMMIPEDHYGQISSRSGLSLRNGIEVGAGVIDVSYRGIVSVLLYNLSDTDYLVKKGDRIAQLILHKISTPEVKQVSELDETLRGEGGFGSSGK